MPKGKESLWAESRAQRGLRVSPVDSALRPSPFLSSPHSGAASLRGRGPRVGPRPRPERLLEPAQTSPGTGEQRWGLCVGLLSPRDKEATNCQTRTPVKCADSFLAPESELHSIVLLFLEELCSHTQDAGKDITTPSRSWNVAVTECHRPVSVMLLFLQARELASNPRKELRVHCTKCVTNGFQSSRPISFTSPPDNGSRHRGLWRNVGSQDTKGHSQHSYLHNL